MFIDLKERGKELGERERNIIDVREKDWWVASWTRPDWGLNLQSRHVLWWIDPQPFGVWGDAPTSWATQPGLFSLTLFDIKI